MSPHTTLVIRHARIRTMDRRVWASALAILDGRIAAVGSDSDVWSAVGSDRPTVDVGGRLVLPGLIDAHLHWASYALARRQVQLEPDLSLAEVVRRTRDHAARASSRGWVLGRGWDQSHWDRWPTAADLDGPIGHRPVALTRKDGHAVWVNSAAMVAAGISVATPNPSGGEIVRLDGSPTGILKENAIRLVQEAIPVPDVDERQAAMVNAWPDAWCQGLTACHDMGYLAGSALFRDLSTLRDAGELGLRFVWYLPLDLLDEAIALGLRSGLGDEWLRVGGLKLFLDGTLGSQTADLLAPYAGQPGNCGIATMPYESFCDVIRRAADAGLATAVHAIGDGANHKALDGFAELAGSSSPQYAGLRHRIEHAQLLDPADLTRFAEVRVIASMQPMHATADMAMADHWWGPRAAMAYAWRTLLDGGTHLAFGSDAPVETLDVFAGVHAAVTRQSANHEPRGGWHPEQRTTVHEAIAAYTTGASWAAGTEDQLGSLTTGHRADLIVLDRDPFSVPPADLMRTRVLATMIEGVWVWQSPGVDLGGPRHDH
jgi:predicted amidohydrolase YtcJ